jgi:hypothetical protein
VTLRVCEEGTNGFGEIVRGCFRDVVVVVDRDAVADVREPVPPGSIHPSLRLTASRAGRSGVGGG